MPQYNFLGTASRSITCPLHQNSNEHSFITAFTSSVLYPQMCCGDVCTCSLENRNIGSQELFLTLCHLKYTSMESRKSEIEHIFYHFISAKLRNSLRVCLTADLDSKGLMKDALGNYSSHKSFYMTVSTK